MEGVEDPPDRVDRSLLHPQDLIGLSTAVGSTGVRSPISATGGSRGYFGSRGGLMSGRPGPGSEIGRWSKTDAVQRRLILPIGETSEHTIPRHSRGYVGCGDVRRFSSRAHRHQGAQATEKPWECPRQLDAACSEQVPQVVVRDARDP